MVVTSHDGDMAMRLQRQSLPYLFTDIGYVCIGPYRAEDNLSHLRGTAREENSLHQAPNLLACEGLGIPIAGVANAPRLRLGCFLHPRRNQFGALEPFRVCAHFISFMPITACPSPRVWKPEPEFPDRPMPLPACAAQDPNSPPQTQLQRLRLTPPQSP